MKTAPLTQIFRKPTTLLLIAVLFVSALLPFVQNQHASAIVSFTKVYVRLDHLTGTTATGGRVCATPSATNLSSTENKVIVNFPATAATDFVVNSTASNWTVDTTFETGSGATAWPGIGTASSVSGKAVTFPSGDLSSSSTLYCFNFSATNTLTTSSAGAAVSTFAYVETQDSGSTQIDKSYWGVTIISGETVTVDAIVAPFFTMTLSGTTDTFGPNPLSSSSVNSSNSARYVQVDTNALNGWILWVKDSQFKTVSDTGTNPANRHGALTSVNAGGYAISNNTTNALATPSASHVFSSGTEDYGLAVTLNQDGTGGGTPSMNAVYDGSTANFAGVIDPTQYRAIASSTGTADADRINIIMRATISNSTPPGSDYTDTLTYIGAGQF